MIIFCLSVDPAVRYNTQIVLRDRRPYVKLCKVTKPVGNETEICHKRDRDGNTNTTRRILLNFGLTQAKCVPVILWRKRENIKTTILLPNAKIFIVCGDDIFFRGELYAFFSCILFNVIKTHTNV